MIPQVWLEEIGDMDDMKKQDESFKPQGSALGRRDLMKMGVTAGAAMAIPASSVAAAQPQPQPLSPQPPQRSAQPFSDAPTGGLQRSNTGQQWPEIAAS